MNKNIFIILGYGVPKDILNDYNYNKYFGFTFNSIFEVVRKNKILDPLVIFSGGKTDCFKPYKRSEASEMKNLFKNFANRSFVRPFTASWKYVTESRSLSTLENLLNCDKELRRMEIGEGKLFIFCEYTRQQRVKHLTRKIFNNKYKIEIIPVDFDMSPNRYLDEEFIAKKENKMLSHDLWALQSDNNFKKYHQIYMEKIKLFRQKGANHKTIKEWWDMRLEELR